MIRSHLADYCAPHHCPVQNVWGHHMRKLRENIFHIDFIVFKKFNISSNIQYYS